MRNILYPKGKTDQNLVLGVSAPSSGLGEKAFIDRYILVRNEHLKNSIKIIEGKCLFDEKQHVSGSKWQRVEDLNNLVKTPEITLIHPPWGGELAIDILELFDFDAIKANPIWIQGYSDISTLLLAITVKTGVATAHGTNFMDSLIGQDELTANSRSYLDLEPGKSFTQKSSDKWELHPTYYSKNLEALFNLTEPTNWTVLNADKAELKGRLIGGCIDTIKHLIGTPYGDIPKFTDEYAKDHGHIIYLENCEQSPTELYRSLISMKYAGWFENVKGVIFGRNNGTDKEEFSYKESVRQALDFLKVPVILDADIGHRAPQMTLINGSLANLSVSNGKATLTQTFV